MGTVLGWNGLVLVGMGYDREVEENLVQDMNEMPYYFYMEFQYLETSLPGPKMAKKMLSWAYKLPIELSISTYCHLYPQFPKIDDPLLTQ